jgi:3-oxoacyl-[acyl-carrier protein] reductase
MLLQDKVAIVYGGGGSVGGAVSRAFAAEGAHVVVCGRTHSRLATTVTAIEAAGGRATASTVDATDAASIAEHFSSVVDRLGHVDISFNLVGLADVQGEDLASMSLDAYLRPIEVAARTHFITATTAARHMAERGAGVIIALTATPSRLAIPLVGGFGTACGAIEAMLRTLAAEVGPAGVRVCGLRSAGSPESFGPDVAVGADGQPAGLADDDYLEWLRQRTILKRFPRLTEVASAAVLVASDHASAITGASINVTCGQLVD